MSTVDGRWTLFNLSLVTCVIFYLHLPHPTPSNLTSVVFVSPPSAVTFIKYNTQTFLKIHFLLQYLKLVKTYFSGKLFWYYFIILDNQWNIYNIYSVQLKLLYPRINTYFKIHDVYINYNKKIIMIRYSKFVLELHKTLCFHGYWSEKDFRKNSLRVACQQWSRSVIFRENNAIIRGNAMFAVSQSA